MNGNSLVAMLITSQGTLTINAYVDNPMRAQNGNKSVLPSNSEMYEKLPAREHSRDWFLTEHCFLLRR